MQSQLTELGLIASLLRLDASWEQCSFEIPGSCIVQCLDEGCIEITAMQNSKQRALVYSAGVHGNETAPIELLDQLLSLVLRGELIPHQNLLLLIGNPEAMRLGCRELGTNLNRLFCGAHKRLDVDGEHVRAQILERHVADFYTSNTGSVERIHLDLHTAIRDSKFAKFVVYPFTHGEALDANSLAWLQACELDCVLFSNTPTTTFSYHSARTHGARAFTIELGKVNDFGENDLTSMSAMFEQLKYLLSAETSQQHSLVLERCHWFEVSETLVKAQAQFELCFSVDLANFTQFENGDVIALQADEPVIISDGPKAVIFPNANVAVGQRAALLVKKMDSEKIRLIAGDQLKLGKF
ncbi:succinylglutamate desuccinylase [Alginatibacterium sediminis]|uniref:Succinylglutamate desuccinylase n=1 Tax=Alginatibacterium sediminis TaxID=2164068 RepID=A0A420EG82_9ALTE|nr:succinylglutamate desuccinylase [Alginatibacterium sediminis]RKF19715.1 succinylglutamate desuccinylase [Alginatibacterium sediminis]